MLILAVVAVGTTGAAWLSGVLTPTHVFARVWRLRLTASEESAARQIRAWQNVDGEGVPVLIDALCDRRTLVAVAAAEKLQAQCQRWRKLDRVKSSRIAAQVTARLRLRTERLPMQTYSSVEQTVRQFITWPIDDKVVDEVQFVADCEFVLTSLMKLRHASIASNGADERARHENESLPSSAISHESSSPAHSPSRETDESPLAVSRAIEPRAIEPFDLPTPPQNVAALPSRSEHISLPTVDPSHDPSQEEDTLFTERQELSSLKTFSDMELFEQLADERAEIVVAAAAELGRRGHSRRTIAIAEQLVDPIPETRMAIAQQLPQLTDIDPRPWLLRLSRDNDVRVRRVAVSLMATSNDPACLRRLREMEATENDKEILQRSAQGLKR